jgi:hypothetical protein
MFFVPSIKNQTMAKDENLHGLLTYLQKCIYNRRYLRLEEGVTYDWLQIARCFGAGWGRNFTSQCFRL